MLQWPPRRTKCCVPRWTGCTFGCLLWKLDQVKNVRRKLDKVMQVNRNLGKQNVFGALLKFTELVTHMLQRVMQTDAGQKRNLKHL